jgi:hypothetical protein
LLTLASLDNQSRLAVKEFALHFSIGCIIVCVPRLLGMRPWQNAASYLAILFTFNSLFNLCRAALRRQKLGGPSLNLWDEAIAFSGCSFLLQAITSYQV